MDLLKKGRQLLFGYNAVVDKNRRRRPTSNTRHEDYQLDRTDRAKAVATQRDQMRNLAWAAWACRTHLDYVSAFKFRATSDDKEWNKRFVKLMREKMRRQNCDVAMRHDFDMMMRIMEACMVTDGDCGLMKVKRGSKLQAIESDQIVKPNKGEFSKEITDHGLVLDSNGAVKWYAVSKRDISNSRNDMLVFDRMVKASNMFFDGYFTRFQQSRGISPLLTALNTNQDLAEAYEYTLIKTKFHAMLGMAITRDATASNDGFNYGNKQQQNSNGVSSTEYNFEMRPGLKLELEPGDGIDMLESKTPNEEFVPYTEAMLRCALLAFDIPFSFYNSQQFSYNAGRQDTIRYIKSAKSKQDRNQGLRNEITEWWLQEWLIDGTITLDEYRKGMDDGFHWQPSGTPLIDPSKEVPAMTQMIANGIKSRTEFIQEMGGDFEATAKLIAEEEALFEELEIKGIGVGQPGQTVLPMIDEEIERQKGGRPTRDEDDNPNNDTQDDGMSEHDSNSFFICGEIYTRHDDGTVTKGM